MIRRLLFCAALGTSVSIARAEGRPLSLTPRLCERLLSESAPEGPLAGYAREIVAFASLTHPILRRAFDHSDDLDFLFDLVFFPTGWMLPPAHRRGRSFRQYRLSTRYRDLEFLFFRRDTIRRFQRRVAHFLAAKDGSSTRREFTRELTQRTLWMICHLANEKHRSSVSHAARERHFNMSVLHFESRTPDQAISVNWDHSFTDEEFARFTDLCYFSRDEKVLGEVLRRLEGGVLEIVSDQRRLVDALDDVTSPDEFRAARARVSGRF